MIWKKIISIKYHNITWNRKRIQHIRQIDENHKMIQPIIFQLNWNSAFLAWFKPMNENKMQKRGCSKLYSDANCMTTRKFVENSDGFSPSLIHQHSPTK